MTKARSAPDHLGIDLGTGSVKAAVVRADHSIAAMASKAYPVNAPQPGWAQSDPAQWLAAAREVAAAALDEAALADASCEVESVSFSGQMHGVVLTDENLEPLRPAILWADTRSAEQAARLGTDLGTEYLSRLGSAPVSGFAATTLAWLRDNEPDVLDRAVHVLQPKDWLRARLGGVAGGVCTDPSDASGTLMYDVVDGQWSTPVIDWLGIDLGIVPRVAGSTDTAGEITLAGRTLRAAVGAADTACALAGLGVDDGFIAVGSGSQVVRVLDRPELDPSLRTHTFATAGRIGQGWYRIGAVQSAGLTLTAVLNWFGASADEANAALAQGVSPSDPIFVPYLSGERTPFMDPGLRGSWVGLSLATDRAAMLRSVVEGVAQAVALGVEAVQASGDRLPGVVPLVGGGTHAPAFRQLLADACGVALAVADAPNAAVVGAALLAEGRVLNPERAALGPTIEPRPAECALLAERRARMVQFALGDDNTADLSRRA